MIILFYHHKHAKSAHFYVVYYVLLLTFNSLCNFCYLEHLFPDIGLEVLSAVDDTMLVLC